MPILNRLASFFGYQPQNGLVDAPFTQPYFGGSASSYPSESFTTREHPANKLFVRGYRYDRRRGALETLPKKFRMDDVRVVSEALGDAARAGIPGIAENITPEIVTAMLLKEGRENLGANEFNVNDPQSMAIYQEYKEKYGEIPAQTVAAVYDKAKVARRLKVPFASAWIGTGRSHYETSGEYAADTERFKEMVAHPKNESLLRFIRGSMMAAPQKR